MCIYIYVCRSLLASIWSIGILVRKTCSLFCLLFTIATATIHGNDYVLLVVIAEKMVMITGIIHENKGLPEA